MQPKPTCYPCTTKTLQRVLDLVTEDENLQIKIFREVMGIIAKVDPAEVHLPIFTSEIFHYIYKRTNCKDPYKDLKKKSNEVAFKILPEIKREINKEYGFQKFRKVLFATILGNLIDFATGHHSVDFDNLKTEFDRIVLQGFEIDDSKKLYDKIKEIDKILILGDNAGEIVFDNLLIDAISEINSGVITYCVKSGPIANDATIIDAKEVGIDKMARIITTGASYFGVEKASKDFWEEFNKHDLIISKGQANFESLWSRTLKKPVAFLLRTKCPPIAKELGVTENKNIVFLKDFVK